jgi:sulfate adenylyltransferase subunit 1 (EFTu-like GTPase family)
MQPAAQFEARLTWRAGEPLLAERSYRLQYLGAEVEVRVTTIKYRVDPQSDRHLAARSLSAGATGVMHLWTADDPVEVSVGRIIDALDRR